MRANEVDSRLNRNRNRIRDRRLARAARVGAVAVALASMGATAVARAAGIKGSPQPELKPFVIGHADGASYVSGDGADGDWVIAYEVATSNTDGAIDVCVLKPGARSCQSTTQLTTEDGSSVFGSPSVTVDGSAVYVAMDECCYAPDLLFESNDGGATFGAPADMGPADGPGIDASETFGVTGFGEHMMWAENDAGASFPVEFAPLGDPGAGQVVTAMTDPAGFETAGLGSDAGQVIAAGGDGSQTIASAAPAGSTVFHTVGQFPNEDLLSVSGPALVTQQTTGNESVVLRLYNGTSFGPAHVVPVSGGGGPHWDIGAWSPAGTFIFTERYQDSYHLEMQSSVSGASWTGRTDLGDAVASNAFSVAMGSIGNGVVVGTSGPATVFPVLAPQPISFKLSKNKVRPNAGVKGSGVGSAPTAGRAVELQELRHGLWYAIATTHEKADGKYSFHIGGHAAGKYTFRASVTDVPGYYQYGYSSSRTLTVAKS